LIKTTLRARVRTVKVLTRAFLLARENPSHINLLLLFLHFDIDNSLSNLFGFIPPTKHQNELVLAKIAY